MRAGVKHERVYVYMDEELRARLHAICVGIQLGQNTGDPVDEPARGIRSTILRRAIVALCNVYERHHAESGTWVGCRLGTIEAEIRSTVLPLDGKESDDELAATQW